MDFFSNSATTWIFSISLVTRTLSRSLPLTPDSGNNVGCEIEKDVRPSLKVIPPGKYVQDFPGTFPGREKKNSPLRYDVTLTFGHSFTLRKRKEGEGLLEQSN